MLTSPSPLLFLFFVCCHYYHYSGRQDFSTGDGRRAAGDGWRVAGDGYRVAGDGWRVVGEAGKNKRGNQKKEK